MILLRRYWLALFFVASAFGIAAVSYAWLPDRIAVHWTLWGEPNSWMPKQIGAFILPAIGLALTAVMIAVAPRAAPGTQPSSMPRVYATVVAAVSAIPLYATIGVVGAAMGLVFDVITYAAVGPTEVRVGFVVLNVLLLYTTFGGAIPGMGG